MADDYVFGKNPSRYDKKKSEATIKAPTPPPLDESFIAMLGRQAHDKLSTVFGPAVDKSDAAVRSAANLFTFGGADQLERALGGSPATRGVTSDDPTGTVTQEKREAEPFASGVGDALGAAGQVYLGAPLVRGAIPALQNTTAGAQAAIQGITGAGQAGAQKVYESVRDDKPMSPAATATAMALGGLFGAGSGAIFHGVAGTTPAGTISQTLPSGLSAAERTAIANQIQRARTVGGVDINLPTAMRLAGVEGAPTVERQFAKGATAAGDNITAVPDELASRLAAAQQRVNALEQMGLNEHTGLVNQAREELANLQSATARAHTGTLREAEREAARAEARSTGERETTRTLSGRTSPRIEDVRKQVMEENRLGMRDPPLGGYSPDIYDETFRRLGDLGETAEQQILRNMMDRTMPLSAARRQAAERVQELRQGPGPTPAEQMASARIAGLEARGPTVSAAQREAQGQVGELDDIRNAITVRPSAPSPPAPGRPREINVTTSGVFGPGFRYRGRGGPKDTSARDIPAYQMMRDQPEVAGGLLGNPLPWQDPAAALTTEAARVPLQTLTEDFFKLNPPRPRPKKKPAQ